jgi:hypothetical protein
MALMYTPAHRKEADNAKGNEKELGTGSANF